METSIASTLLEAGFLNMFLNISMKQFKCRAYLGSHSLPILQDFFLGMKMAYTYHFVPQIRKSHNCNKRKKNNIKKQK